MPKAKIVTDLKNSFFTNNKLTIAASQPSGGTYKAGDIVISSSPNNNAYGWICTVSGTPGTWKILKSASDVSNLSWDNISGKPSTFPPTLGTSSSTAYRGDYGNIAYNHSQSAHAPANAQRNADITKAEIEAKLTGNITSHSHSAYAPVNHGTHVPTPESANNARFLRNDATWQTVTAENIGAVKNIRVGEYGNAESYVKICSFIDAGTGNVHGEFLLSGFGSMGDVDHTVALLRVSGRGDRKIQYIKMVDGSEGTTIGYVREGSRTTVYLKRPVWDAGGTIMVLNATNVTVYNGEVSGSRPSGFIDGSNITSYQYMKVSPVLSNSVFLKGVMTDGGERDILTIDGSNNIQFGNNNQCYIDIHNTMRVYRDIHMQDNTQIVAKGIRVNGGGNWNSIGFGANHVRLEYAKGDCLYVAGSETVSGGYGTPFRAKYFENVENRMKFGNNFLTIGPSATAYNNGDVWIQI